MTTRNESTDPASNQSTTMKSVTLEQLLRLEAKSVVGASNASSMHASAASKTGGDAKKIGKTLEKVDRDGSGPASRKRTKDSETMKKDIDKRIGDGIPPADAGRI